MPFCLSFFCYTSQVAEFYFVYFSAKINVTPPLPSTKLALLKSVPLAFLVKFAVTFEEVITNQHFKQKHAVADMPSIFVLENHENQ